MTYSYSTVCAYIIALVFCSLSDIKYSQAQRHTPWHFSRTIDTIRCSLNDTMIIDLEQEEYEGKISYHIKAEYYVIRGKEQMVQQLLSAVHDVKDTLAPMEFMNGKLANVSFDILRIHRFNNANIYVYLETSEAQDTSWYIQTLRALPNIISPGEHYEALIWDLKPYETIETRWGWKGKRKRIQIPTSHLDTFNLLEQKYDLDQFEIRDRYPDLTQVFLHNPIPLDPKARILLLVDETGHVSRATFTDNKGGIEMPLRKDYFEDIQFPVEILNGKASAYTLRLNEDVLQESRWLRFRRDRDSNIVKPIFKPSDSLFVYHSALDGRFYLYTTKDSYSGDDGPLVSFEDTITWSDLFYDYNKDGLTDFVYPLYQENFNKLQVVVYQGGPRNKYGLYKPAHYHYQQFSSDSIHFTTHKHPFMSGLDEHQLLMFTKGGHKVLLRCYKSQYYPLSKKGRQPKGYIPPEDELPGYIFEFENNLHGRKSKYHYRQLKKAEAEFNRIRELITFYRNHPSEIPH